jgi:hypothetical protein
MSWPNLRQYPSICVLELRVAMKNSISYSVSGMNYGIQKPLEYSATQGGLMISTVKIFFDYADPSHKAKLLDL